MTRRLGLAMSTLVLALITTCKEEPINFTCANPLGTEAVTLNVNGLSCFQNTNSGCFEFNIYTGLLIIRSYYVNGDSTEAPKIKDIGQVQCLSKVTQRPTTGYSYAVYATRKHGYVFKMKDGTLGRLYIDSWQTSGSTFTSVNIEQQYSY